MTSKKQILAVLAALALAPFAIFADMSEISVDIKMDGGDFVQGERVRGVVKVKNTTPHVLSVGYPDSKDSLFVEVYASADMTLMERKTERPFVAPFKLGANGVQKLEVFLGDHYRLGDCRRFLARPVLVHAGVRYEGQYRAFDIVAGMEAAKAMQVFANRDGLSREFRLVHWARNGSQHLFLSAQDSGTSNHAWETRDVGPMMKITPPTISILPDGRVIVIHRYGPDHFIKSEFWSLPDVLEFHERQLVNDPETAGHSRVQELYSESGGVKPAERPWWKFW